MKTVSRIAIVLAIAAPVLALAQTSTWTIDTAHTRAGFSVKHLVISDVKGEFGSTTGKAQIDDADLSKSSVEAVIAVSTVDTRDPKRDGHLRSADFFDVTKYPEITFKSTKVEAGPEGKLNVVGNLTIRGTTKVVTLDGELTKAITDPWGNTRRGFAATTKVNRKDFGVSWGGVTDAGPVVGNDVKIDIQAELVKDKAPAPKS